MTNTLPQHKEDWMERRTLRRDKQELVELQQNIQTEIKAKEQIMKDLTLVRSQLADTER